MPLDTCVDMGSIMDTYRENGYLKHEKHDMFIFCIKQLPILFLHQLLEERCKASTCSSNYKPGYRY